MSTNTRRPVGTCNSVYWQPLAFTRCCQSSQSTHSTYSIQSPHHTQTVLIVLTVFRQYSQSLQYSQYQQFSGRVQPLCAVFLMYEKWLIDWLSTYSPYITQTLLTVPTVFRWYSQSPQTQTCATTEVEHSDVWDAECHVEWMNDDPQLHFDSSWHISHQKTRNIGLTEKHHLFVYNKWRGDMDHCYTRKRNNCSQT